MTILNKKKATLNSWRSEVRPGGSRDRTKSPPIVSAKWEYPRARLESGIGSVIGLGAKMDEIAEAASYLSPNTLAGAAFQVMLASAEVDTIGNGADASQLKASTLMIQRLLYRSLEMMRGELAKFPRSKSYMMSDRFDPRVQRTSSAILKNKP